MIDLEKAKEEFLKYTAGYDHHSDKIVRKENHSLRVIERSRMIAEYLKLNEEDTQLAELIGLLHDIGRFEQVRRYNTYSDQKSGVNHGMLGAEILFEDGLIRRFIEEDKYDEIIRKAIINHNRTHTDPDLNERELLFAKIIRDADKADIMYILASEDLDKNNTPEEYNTGAITKELMKQFLDDGYLDYTLIESKGDEILTHFAMTGDINYPVTAKYVLEEKLIDIYAQVIKDKYTNPDFIRDIEVCHKVSYDRLKKIAERQ
jgi:putative nucleotidyltransferase with HDIG domain